MPASRLAILAAACLLPGAALPQTASLQSVFECKAGLQASLAATANLPVVQQIDHSEAPNRDLKRYFDPTPGLTVFGMTPNSIGVGEVDSPSRRRTMLISVVAEPYARVEAAVLAAHGLTACPYRRPEQPETCQIYSRPGEPERPSMLLLGDNGVVAIACAYSPAED